MKRLIPFLPALLLLVFVLTTKGGAFMVDNVAPGATATQSPIECPTASTAAALLPCQASSVPTSATLYYEFCVHGGTAGTDVMFVNPAPVASPCASATPAPNATVGTGIPFPTGGAGWTCTPFNWPSAGGGQILSSEWDMSCTASSMTVIPIRLP
jgi:hypothetical protein